jgi:heparosan-N-sulfate-glucuronate 5-epimerase
MTPTSTVQKRMNYYRRIFGAYLTPSQSQLTFWHEQPEASEFTAGELGRYYMTFAQKADYAGTYDTDDIPMLDYLGVIGPQYNPIAIAQYGLGNFNQWIATGDSKRREKFLKVADWLVGNLEQNAGGFMVWNHHFDFEYRTPLRAPWYSGLAQGQGISVLVRAHKETGYAKYLEAARSAFRCMLAHVDVGGVVFKDEQGHRWIEEYIVSPPTHILNGFLWALWGVYDLALLTNERVMWEVWEDSLATLKANLNVYDTGYWSLYEQSGTRMKMMASPFYHRLHIVQLRVMAKLTGDEFYREYAERWAGYMRSRMNRSRALVYKSVFKLCYY